MLEKEVMILTHSNKANQVIDMFLNLMTSLEVFHEEKKYDFLGYPPRLEL